MEGQSVGLKECTNDAGCGPGVKCQTNTGQYSLKARPGFCEDTVALTCHGLVDGARTLCTKNSDCTTGTNPFCDMDIDRTSGSIPAGKGICCQLSSLCGGDMTVQEAGIKLCQTDANCDQNNGEMCDIHVKKPTAAFSWKTGQGVCCKMTCGNSAKKEAVQATPLAGPICDAPASCADDKDHIKVCSQAPNSATYKRCCKYKRRPDVCKNLANAVGPSKSGFNVNECPALKKSECPVGASCTADGLCCEMKKCKDGFTELAAQKSCSNAGKDCDQPKFGGASCENGFCCPNVEQDKSKFTITDPFLTNQNCNTPSDCPSQRMYCHEKQKKCVVFRKLQALKTKNTCGQNARTCKDDKEENGVCVFQSSGVAVCHIDPMSSRGHRIRTNQDKDEEDELVYIGMILGITGVLAGFMFHGILGFYVYYRVSVLRVRRKKEAKAAKAEESKRKELDKTKEDTMAKDPITPSSMKTAITPVDPNQLPPAQPQYYAM